MEKQKQIKKTEESKKGVVSLLERVQGKAKEIFTWLYAVMFVNVLMPINAYATEPTYTDTNSKNAWNTVMNFILTWVPRIGLVVLFVGAIEFALAFKSEDAEGKTKGLRTIIAGAMVVAIPVALKSLIVIA